MKSGTALAHSYIDLGSKGDLSEMTNTDLQTEPGTSSPQPFEQLVKYIRVRSKEGARFVEFDFAIGDPSLFVELVMPQGVFDEFCQKNHVVTMSDEQMQAVDEEMEKWRYGEETLMAANHRHDEDHRQDFASQ